VKRAAAPALAASLLLLGLLPARAAEVDVERLELGVRIEPGSRMLYARATFFLRNLGPDSVELLEFALPEKLADRFLLRAVWDRGGELGWRADPPEAGAAPALRVALRAPLAPRKGLVLVVAYDLDLNDFDAWGDRLQVTPESARLPTTGWYPWPANAHRLVPSQLRLFARVPKQWPVAAPAKLKRSQEGTLLTSYELVLFPVRPDEWLFRAGDSRVPQ